MKRLAALLVMISVLGFPATRSSFVATKPNPAKMLLAINQFPVGWSIEHPTGGGSATGCLTPKRLLPRTIAQASATFAKGDLPEVDEVIYVYGQPIVAGFRRAVATMNNCRALQVKVGSKTITVHVGRMSFPTVGDASSAYAFSFSVQGLNAGADVVVARRGRVVMVLEELDIGHPDIRQFEHFTRLAIAKIS